MSRQPISVWLLAWVELAQALCAILTLGFAQPGWRMWLLFSCRWFERLGEWEAPSGRPRNEALTTVYSLGGDDHA